jgi:hypothetical protein
VGGRLTRGRSSGGDVVIPVAEEGGGTGNTGRLTHTKKVELPHSKRRWSVVK